MKGELLQSKRESFTVLPRAPSLRGLSPKVTGGVKLPLSGELASVCETESMEINFPNKGFPRSGEAVTAGD